MTPKAAHEWLFGYGLREFMNLYPSWTETKARKILGKWMHTYGSQLTARAVDNILEHRPLEPVSRAVAWLQAVQAKEAEKHKPGFRPAPVTFRDPPPQEERQAVAEKLARLRQELEARG